MSYQEILEKVDLFEELSPEYLAKLNDIAKVVFFKKDKYIFRENEIGDSFYIVIDGKVSITKNINIESNDQETSLMEFGNNDYFGEMSLIEEEGRSASALCLTDCHLLQFIKSDFIELCMENPHILLLLTKKISSRLRETNERYVKTWDSLLRKNKLAAIGTAASKIVHDIKTPITIIVLTAQMIKNSFPESSKSADKIIKQTKTLDTMVREILEFARGEQSSVMKLPVQFDDFFNDIIDNTEPMADDREIRILTNNRVNKDKSIKFDEKKIKRVIINLIKNSFEALKFQGRVYFEAEIKNNLLHLEISDDGPGIPEKIIDQLFEPFVTMGKSGGTGLGLAIVKKIISDHNGTITVRNKDKGGAQFDIWLPKE
jgi:signal transduction histidine kinase